MLVGNAGGQSALPYDRMERLLSRSHLFLLCGLPFSGKSTLARALQVRFGIVHVEVDRHHLDGQAGFDGRRIERSEWITAYQAAYCEVDEAFAQGRSVVFDAVSYRRNQRDRIRRIAAKHGVPMTIVYFDVTPEEAKTRVAANRQNPVRVNVPDEDMAEIAAGMQPPRDDEHAVRYHPSEPIESWIDRVIQPLMKETDS
jgi:predicted kinase